MKLPELTSIYQFKLVLAARHYFEVSMFCMIYNEVSMFVYLGGKSIYRLRACSDEPSWI